MTADDQDVIEAAELLGEELTQAKKDTTDSEFESLLVQCNEAISERTGIEYSSACGADESC